MGQEIPDSDNTLETALQTLFAAYKYSNHEQTDIYQQCGQSGAPAAPHTNEDQWSLCQRKLCAQAFATRLFRSPRALNAPCTQLKPDTRGFCHNRRYFST